MKATLAIVLLLSATVVAAVAIAKMFPNLFAGIDWKSFARCAEYWINRYQTFLGVLVAIAVAWLTISAMTKQNNISERQFLSGQVQSLIGDRGTLQFVIAQLREVKSQKQIFWNNIAFLDSEGDKSVGWQNGPNLIRTAFGNVEGFRNLVSSNTAKFMGPTGTRARLIEKLDYIVSAQDGLRDAFYKWAIINRNYSADPAAPPTPEKEDFFRQRDAVLGEFENLLVLSEEAVTELDAKVSAVERDISDLQKLIDAKTDR